MNILIFVLFGICILPMFILAIFLFKGKGRFLIAGYNTMSKEEQEKYNEKDLCRFVGWLLIVVSISVLLIPLGIQFESMWLMYSGIALTIVIPFVAAIYMNTGNRFRKDDNSDLYAINKNDSMDKSSQSKKSRNMNRRAVFIASRVFTVLILIIVGIMLIYSEKEPVVTVSDQGLQIKSIYGLSVNFTDVSDIMLIEKSMNEIGVGRRTNGYGGFGDTLKGNFFSDNLGATLLFVHANSSPTIKIDRVDSKDIYINFRDGEATRNLYEDMIIELFVSFKKGNQK